MKVCLFSPYVPGHFGGGEKFLFDAASALAKQHTVFVAVPQKSPISQIKQDELHRQYGEFLGRSLESITFISTPLWVSDTSFLSRLLWTKQFDVLFFATDGSLFFSLASRNILHIQIPFSSQKRSLIDRLKLLNWQVKSANSAFTQQIVSKNWHCEIPFVHYPQIDVSQLTPTKQEQQRREKVILHVGRFFRHLHTKRQDVLVSAFKKLRESKKSFSDWKLVFIGTVEDESYFAEVKAAAADLPVFFYTTLNRAEVLHWYKKATFYWHATGYGVNELLEPEKVEHFGISTVEAMAAGCVPLVFNAGGQREILNKELEYCLWNTVDQCIEKTIELVSDDTLYTQLQSLSIRQSNTYSPDKFVSTLTEMVQNA